MFIMTMWVWLQHKPGEERGEMLKNIGMFMLFTSGD